jgi:ribosome maturation factor RimP
VGFCPEAHFFFQGDIFKKQESFMKRAPAKPIQLSSEQIQKIEAAVFALVESQLDSRFYLLNVTFEKEAGYWYLRIYLESNHEPVSLSDCEKVSRQIDTSIDELNILQDLSYSLEVSSAGIFRPLKTQREFDFYKTRPVRVETIQPKKSKVPVKTVVGPEGMLKSFNEATQVLTLEQANGETLNISLAPDQVVYLNPTLHFPEESAEEVECF